MRASVTLSFAVVISCTRSRPLPYDLAQISDTTALAIVEADRAVFVFPKEVRRTFLWPASSFDPTLDKFAWGITILAGDTSFLPGVQVYRGAHPTSFSSLADVVGAGEPGLLFNPGGHMQMLDRTGRVATRVSGGRVIVTIHGADQIRRILRDSPPTVRFGVVAPLEPLWRQNVVNVLYNRSP